MINYKIDKYDSPIVQPIILFAYVLFIFSKIIICEL